MANNGLNLDPDEIWDHIKDPATAFPGTVMSGASHNARRAIAIAGDKKKGAIISSDEVDIRIYSQFTAGASSYDTGGFEKFAKGVGDSVVAGVAAGGKHDYVGLADILVRLAGRIAKDTTGEAHTEGRFKLNYGIPIDDDDDAEDANDDPIGHVRAKLTFGGRFFVTDDDGESSHFSLDAILESSDSDTAHLEITPKGEFETNGNVKVFHGPGVSKSKKDAVDKSGKPKDVNGIKPVEGNWYKYEITLDLKDQPVHGSSWPLLIDIDVDCYAEWDVDPFPNNNTTIVTVEEMLLTLDPIHDG